MSSKPFLSLKATRARPDQNTTPHAGKDLDEPETLALLALVERIGHKQCLELATDPQQAHLMMAALDKLRTTLERATAPKRYASPGEPYESTITIELWAKDKATVPELFNQAVEMMQSMPAAAGQGVLPDNLGSYRFTVDENHKGEPLSMDKLFGMFAQDEKGD